jgi:hypothetical protein
MFEEIVYVSEFNILPMGCIGVRKITEALKNGADGQSFNYRR